MFVMVLVAVYYIGEADPPIAAITRSTIEHYPTMEACGADAEKQMKKFAEGVPPKAIGYAAKCVEVTGPAGQKA